jgi:hypothetical protein
MKITNTLQKNMNNIAFAIICLLLLLSVALSVEVLTLNSKVNAATAEVNKVHQDITCAEVLNNGSTRQQSCIGIKEQLDDIQQRMH